MHEFSLLLHSLKSGNEQESKERNRHRNLHRFFLHISKLFQILNSIYVFNIQAENVELGHETRNIHIMTETYEILTFKWKFFI